jgi:hypothetical protein
LANTAFMGSEVRVPKMNQGGFNRFARSRVTEPLLGDNQIMHVPKAFAQKKEFAVAVRKVEQQLRREKEAVRIRYELDYDSTGDPAVHFRIVLPDDSLKRENLVDATLRVSYVIEQKLQPQVRWGINPYYRFRSQTEHEASPEPAWA